MNAQWRDTELPSIHTRRSERHDFAELRNSAERVILLPLRSSPVSGELSLQSLIDVRGVGVVEPSIRPREVRASPSSVEEVRSSSVAKTAR